jgi:hypothetical protein
MDFRHEITPDPARITESLRDTGYTLNTAIADIIDNSISAGATNISLELGLDVLGGIRFSVTDDGIGMNSKQLVNAFKYGSDRRDDPSSLGKFGLGLKTASTAFARRLMITSISVSESTPSTFVFDLDQVKDHGWQVTQFASPDANDKDLLTGPHGTVVRWQKIDRILPGGEEISGTKGKRKIQKIISELKAHLSMTFARFLDSEDERARFISLSLNGERVEPWNPFGFESEMTLSKLIKVQTPNGQEEELVIRAFTLPRKSELQALLGPNSPDEARLEGKYQGVYVYRENRMIHGPDWLGIWAQEPHQTLCRVELSFGFPLDEAFQIDIKKSKISVDPNLEDTLKQILSGPRRHADQRYREGRVRELGGKAPLGVHEPANKAIQGASPTVSRSTLESKDPAKGSAVISNALGRVTVKYTQLETSGVFVEAVDELPFNVLYEPRWINQNPGVYINKSHPFYTKVYLPNLNSGVTIQAIDSLLWALANAEFDHTQESTRRTFEDMRYHISRALHILVEDLPEPMKDE